MASHLGIFLNPGFGLYVIGNARICNKNILCKCQHRGFSWGKIPGSTSEDGVSVTVLVIETVAAVAAALSSKVVVVVPTVLSKSALNPRACVLSALTEVCSCV